MKVILSRKGFDDKYGEMPSLIMPNGELVSLPIPEANTGIKYNALTYNGDTFKKILEDLGYKYKDEKTGNVVWDCHLDPDIFPYNTKVPEWQALFGQSDAAAGHLINECVKKGDLFIFFGTFRKVEKNLDGKYYYVKPKKEMHLVYGYFQIEDMAVKDEVKKFHWHPHSTTYYLNKPNNIILIPAKNLEGTNFPGYGVLKFSEELVLTNSNMTKSKWKPDHILTTKDKMTYNPNAKKGTYFQSSPIGQEFVISDEFNSNEDVRQWLIGLLNK